MLILPIPMLCHACCLAGIYATGKYRPPQSDEMEVVSSMELAAQTILDFGQKLVYIRI